VHTYRVTPLSVWNACAAGVTTAEIVETLREFSKYPVPAHVMWESVIMRRVTPLRLTRDPRGWFYRRSMNRWLRRLPATGKLRPCSKKG